MSQREMAHVLTLSESMISRIEAGTRNPPRTVDFCQRLRDIPGLTDAEVATLVRASGVLVPLDGQEAADRVAAVSFVPSDGLLVELRLHTHPPDSAQSGEDLQDLLGMLTADVEFSLRDYRRRVERRHTGGRTRSGSAAATRRFPEDGLLADADPYATGVAGKG